MESVDYTEEYLLKHLCLPMRNEIPKSDGLLARYI